MTWDFKGLKRLNLKRCVFIEGLPGLGNVGKIAVDFLIEELGAEKVVDIFSYALPNSVFVNEDNLVELPKIEIYLKKVRRTNFLFLAGDVQPVEEYSSYEFADELLDFLQKNGCVEIVTLGGIGLDSIPKKPSVYVTGNMKKFVSSFRDLGVKMQVHGVVGPIVGISGILLGLGRKRNIPSAALLAETYAHPMFIGLKGAREMVKALNKRYDFGISLKNLNRDIKSFEKNVKDELLARKKQNLSSKYHKMDTNYIG